MVSCINLERDLDGSLVSRPPIQNVADMDGAWAQRIKMLGVGVFSSGNYLIGSNSSGVFYYKDGLWTVITNAFVASAVVQYNNKMYLLATPSAGVNTLAQWDPVGGYVLLNPANLATMMASTVGGLKGGTALSIYKDRLWITTGAGNNASCLIYSDLGAPQTYSLTTQFFNVRPGDGQNLLDLVQYNDSLVLFKNDATFVLSFTDTPLNAQIICVNNFIGVSGANQVCLYENVMFLYHEGFVYEISNYNFTQINEKVPFVYDASASSTRVDPVFISLFGKRLVVRYYNTVYVYKIQTKTWSTYTSRSGELANFGPLVAMPSNVVNAVNIEYYAGSSLNNSKKVFLIKDGYSPADIEKLTDAGVTTPYPIDCSIQTKDYDLANAYQFKKLNYWGADLKVSSAVTGTATPVLVGFRATWGLIFSAGLDWATLNTWFNPIAAPAVTTIVGGVTGSAIRRFVKFPKALRYRLINFKLSFTTDGSTASGPAKIFSLTMFTSTKQVVPKASN